MPLKILTDADIAAYQHPFDARSSTYKPDLADYVGLTSHQVCRRCVVVVVGE